VAQVLPQGGPSCLLLWRCNVRGSHLYLSLSLYADDVTIPSPRCLSK